LIYHNDYKFLKTITDNRSDTYLGVLVSGTVDIVIKHGLIGFNELQRKIGFSSRRTLGLWLERLDVFGILDKER
jgi:hypothetical protein